MKAAPWLAALCVSLTAAAPRAALAEEDKIAVLVVGATPADADTADNLTEVIIARIARRGSFNLAGTAVFRKRLGIDSEARARHCLDDLPCLSGVAVSLGVTRIVSGSVGARDKQFLFTLVLRSMSTGEVTKRVFRLIDGSVGQLVASAQQATDDLFLPRPEPGHVRVECEPGEARVSIDEAYVGTTPIISGDLVPGKHRIRVEKVGHFPWHSEVEVPSAGHLEINLTPANLPERKAWPSYAAFGSAAGSVALLLTGAVLGSLAAVEPTSPNRAIAQDEFEQRRRLGASANGALAGAAALGAASLYLFLRYHEHVFGR
jgi:hypothetical protein